MSYFLYQGHQIYYEDIGKGKPVIFFTWEYSVFQNVSVSPSPLFSVSCNFD